jgi:penicillin-binding protein 2
VVNEGGTGGRARIVGLDIGGKTGTAQVASNELAKAKRGDPDLDLRDNAWFVGLSPTRNPEIAVAVLYERGEHSYNAAPVAREVIRVYWEKKGAKPAGRKPTTSTQAQPAQPSAGAQL